MLSAVRAGGGQPELRLAGFRGARSFRRKINAWGLVALGPRPIGFLASVAPR